MRAERERLLGVVFCGAFFAFGTALAWSNLEEARMRARLVPASAVILNADVRMGDSPQGPAYYPEVIYRYAFRGRTYTGARLRIRAVDYSRAWAVRAAGAYPPGSTWTAWVDPERPSYAVLDRSLAWLPWLLMVVFLAIGGGGLWTVFMLDRRPRRSR